MDAGVLIVGGVAVALLDLYAYYRFKYSQDVLEHSIKLKNETLLKKHASAFEVVEMRLEKEQHVLAMDELNFRMRKLSGELRLLAESIDVSRVNVNPLNVKRVNASLVNANSVNVNRLKIKEVA